MKKLFYLLSFILVATLISCEEEEIVPKDTSNDGLITLLQLDGEWEFDGYEYDGIVWKCGSIEPEYDGIEDVFDDIIFETEEDSPNYMTYKPRYVCGDYDYSLQNSFTKEGNTINLSNMTLTIIEYNSGRMKMRVESTKFNYEYIGGNIILMK